MTTPRAENQQSRAPANGRTSPRLLSPIELADYLGVPLATVYHWRAHHGGPIGIRVGRHIRYRTHDVERWLDANRDDYGREPI